MKTKKPKRRAITLRISPEIHAQLTEAAKLTHRSLTQYATYILEGGK